MRTDRLISATAMLLCSMSCGTSESKTPEPVPVMIQVVSLEPISRTVYAPCRLEAASEAVVSVSVPSMVEEVLVNAGDTVSQGQRLLVLRTDDMRRSSVNSAAAVVEASRASLEFAGSNLHRAEELFSQGSLSIQQFQARETEALAAEAAYSQALAGYAAALSSAGNGYVTAPFSGTVGRVIATRGNLASGPLLSMFAGDAFKAELLIAPRHLQWLDTGIPAVFTTDHFPGVFFQGYVTAFAPAADPVSGLVPVSVQYNDTSGMLVPGLSGLTMLSLETRDSVVVLGENTLKPLGECCFEASIVQEGTAHIVQVSTGLRNGNRHEVISGILPGDSVITLGNSIVSEGDAVRVVNP